MLYIERHGCSYWQYTTHQLFSEFFGSLQPMSIRKCCRCYRESLVLIVVRVANFTAFSINDTKAVFRY